MRQFSLVLKYRTEWAALQAVNNGWRNAAGEIHAATGLQRHGRIAGQARQP